LFPVTINQAKSRGSALLNTNNNTKRGVKTMSELVLGIDMGTTGVRVGIFDMEGTPVVFCEENYRLYTPHSGWAEQDPNEWWECICKASKRAIMQMNINPERIIGMSVDTTCCTVMAFDKNFVPMRNAIMWMDLRAADQAVRISQSRHPSLKYNGFGNVSAESMPCKALWLKENEPDIYNNAKYIGECTDWLMHRLTGEITASINTTSIRWYYDSENNGWPVDFYNKIGLGDLIEKFPKRVLDLGEVAGTLTAETSEEMGLRPGIPVGQGGADAFIGMIGLNVVKPNRMALITGSSHLHLALCNKEFHSKGMWGSYPDAVIKGLHTVEGGQTSTGSIIQWFKNNYCGDVKKTADEKGVSVYDILNEEAMKLKPGSEGLLFLDYFQGNRTPYADPDIRGLFYGLSVKHTAQYLFRAIIESICYGTAQIVDIFKKSGMMPESIYISGGATKSPLWMQTHSDICNVPILIPKVCEAPCLGSAILGAVAGGAYSNISSAAEAMVKIVDQIEPNKNAYEAYQFYYERYNEAYDLFKDWMHSITKHRIDSEF